MDIKHITHSNSLFGLNLFKLLIEEKKNGNIFISPLSISMALAMTQLGARDNTANQMASVLGWNVSDENIIHEEFQKYIMALQAGSENQDLSTANRIYIEKTLGVLPEYITKAKELYYAEPVSANFSANPESERLSINDWVSQETHGKIKDLLAPGMITSLSTLVLVNAIYFKGQWARQFDASNSRPMPFKVSPSIEKDVLTMNTTRQFAFKHFADVSCTALEIPYKGSDLAMIILLPDDNLGLGKLLSDLNKDSFSALLNSGQWPTALVNLSLPKFKVTSRFNLNSALQSLGMRDAFSKNEANFMGMTASKCRGVFISSVLHEAVVQVDEAGTEAAAATTVAMAPTGMPRPVPSVVVDRPFLFVITDRRVASQMVLFMGVVVDPSEE